jgi:DNA-binding transcriptional ArsR family regulator
MIVSIMAKYDPDLSLLFHALADPSRRLILARLAKGTAAVSELAAPTGLRLPTVMQHLTVLETAGLVVSTKSGRVRSCSLVPAALEPMRGWLEEQRVIWESRLDRLDDYVMTLMEKQK